ncbi:MAG: hypothetical protein NC311_18430 [Muribaculaceae bacterium]|nr:hypothetical protein [Muribaculaceae bacterium]
MKEMQKTEFQGWEKISENLDKIFDQKTEDALVYDLADSIGEVGCSGSFITD